MLSFEGCEGGGGCVEQGGFGMRDLWNPLDYISDWGWTCILSAAGLLFAVLVLTG